jgi:lipoprotein-releasing system ATP-binding protein
MPGEKSKKPILQLQGIHKHYAHMGKEVQVLRGVELDIFPGDQMSIVGKSGVGKSTLLHVAGTLDPPTAGVVLSRGQDVFRMPEPELAAWRNKRIGFVFQFHHLLPEFSALENVMLPALIGGIPWSKAREKAMILIQQINLEHRVAHRPGEMSGGEQQRVALARALVMDPDILLADEPTGNLDERTSEEIHELLARINETVGVALVLVTHNFSLARKMDRKLILTGGSIQDWDGTPP